MVSVINKIVVENLVEVRIEKSNAIEVVGKVFRTIRLLSASMS